MFTTIMEHLIQIDEEDFWLLHEYSWGILEQTPDKKYVSARGPDGTVRLHRLIMSAPEGKVVDHINGDTLDNRRENLRVCTQQQNCFNSKASSSPKKTSKYKGVSFAVWNPNPKWIAAITIDRKRVYLGSFATEEEAAVAYNDAAVFYFGQYANLNRIGIHRCSQT